LSGVLEGVRVLDISQGAAGPTCAMLLGDLGAVVVKVEPPGGEWGRRLGPPFLGGVSAAFLGMNRGKRSVGVDLKTPGAAETLIRVAEGCDVLLESFRPGVADRLGIGYEAMHARNPRLVYAAISAFGQDGPWRDLPGVDGVVQAMSGLMSVTGTTPGPPVKVGVPAGDMLGGIFASQAVLAALLARERTGAGQRVDVSLLDALLAFQVVPFSMYQASGEAPGRLGSAAPYAAPNEAFATSDGHVMVAAYTPQRWPALCTVLGVPELATDPRFCSNGERVVARESLHAILEAVFATRSTAVWMALLQEVDIICGPLLDYDGLMSEEHFKEYGLTVRAEHPAVGALTTVRGPVRFSSSRAEVRECTPAITAEHTQEVLAEAGFDKDEITELLASGAVFGSAQQRPADRA
jgi:crotonobetainyl-CoA:carnitine CoA-transferase CaiB-like acyl-CoA transferase